MLQVARLAPTVLGDAAARVETFLRAQFHGDGGAIDRAGDSDLYYTVFALEGLIALRAELPVEQAVGYLVPFGSGDDLDLIHLACLARCWAALPGGASEELRARLAANVERFRSGDGSYAAESGRTQGSIYHAFMAHAAHQDLGSTCPDLDRLIESIGPYRTQDGGFTNTPGLRIGTTPPTAAAVTLLAQLGQSAPPEVGKWLLSQLHPDGGFVATPGAPLPDLLSTATALHALVVLREDLAPVVEHCLDFVDTLWTGQAFCGHWADDVQDCEYTYYGLLALGHLSVV